MNFLSHFYFDRDTDNCYLILGTVLPDLLKNADKNVIIHPEKLHHPDPSVNSIIQGWKKHLEVDRYFHSSEFFITHSHKLKKMLLPAIEGSPVKPFFLGHIALELILDNLLLTTNKVTADGFYDHLDGCKEDTVAEFLTFSGLKDNAIFFKFYEGFKKSRYLFSYSETPQITYALKRICMRIWENPFTPEQEINMNEVILAYRESLLAGFMAIFDDIESKLMGTDDTNPDFEEPGDRPLINADRHFVPLPQRHGCVTAWLMLTLILSSIMVLVYFYIANKPIQIPKLSITTEYLFIMLALLNVIFSIKLLSWKKSGFYGLCMTIIVGFLINIVNGISPLGAYLGLAGLPMLFGILQIKKNGRSTWEYLK